MAVDSSDSVKPNQARVLIGNTLALTAAVAFAFGSASASVAFQSGSNPITLGAVRFVLPVLVLTAWLTAEGRSIWLPKRDGWIAAGLGILTAVYTWALLHSIGLIPLALAILVFYLFPVVATVLLGLFGWEALGWKTKAAIVLAFVGMALALDPRVQGVNAEGVTLGIVAAVGLGIVVAASSRVFRGGDSRPATLYMSAVAAVLLIAFCAQQGDIALPTTAKGWIGFTAAALFHAFAIIAFYIAVSMIGPARTSLLSYAEPVAAASLGVVLLGETLTLTQTSGIALMVAALAGASVLRQQSVK